MVGKIEDMSVEEIKELPEQHAYLLARQANGDMNNYFNENQVSEKPHDVLLFYKARQQGLSR